MPAFTITFGTRLTNTATTLEAEDPEFESLTIDEDFMTIDEDEMAIDEDRIEM